jgi:hypothetical protein
MEWFVCNNPASVEVIRGGQCESTTIARTRLMRFARMGDRSA